MRQDIGRMTLEGDTRGRKGGGEGYGESKTHDKREEEKMGRMWGWGRGSMFFGYLIWVF